MESLLQNAVESIQIGIADYQASENDPRRMQSAFRNFHAGVLLLCKEVLLRLCPEDSGEVHIKSEQKVIKEPDGSFKVVGVGKHTVNEEKIKSRFKDLGIKTDLSTLKDLSAIRNEMEHYWANKPKPLMQQAFSAALPIVRDIIINEFEEEPVDVLGKECWSYMTAQAAIYDKQRALCKATFKKMDWDSDVLSRAVAEFRCSSCGSDLVKQQDDANTNVSNLVLVCTECGEELDSEGVLEKAIEEEMWADCHIAGQEGQDSPLETCPSCDRETYIVEEGKCALCGEELGESECGICGEGLSYDERAYGEGGICGYCQHKMDKVKND